MSENSKEAAELNARFQESGISLEERVAALEDAMKMLLAKHEDVKSEKFQNIDMKV